MIITYNVAFGQILQVNIGNDITLCNPGEITLEAIASGGSGTYSYSWSTNLDASYITVYVDKSTTYSVTVYDGIDTAYDDISINLTQPIKSFFTYSKDAAGVNFYSVSSGNIIQLYWDFGDGTTSSSMYNNIIQYSTDSSKYKVCLTVKDSAMCESSYCTDVFPNQLDPCHTQFDFLIDQTYNEISFYNYSDQKTNTQYVWDFGDGNTSSEYYAWHQYENSGTFNLCLTVLDTVQGCSNNVCRELVFNKKPICNSYFYYMLENVGLQKGIVLTNNSSGVDTYYWQFGDGATSSEYSPSHVYAKDSTYNVCLFVTNSTNGCQGSYCSEVFIEAPLPCYVDFQYSTEGNNVNFNNKSYNQPYTKYSWDFGDGITSDVANPIHTYTASGTYQVCLTVNDSVDSCTNSYCQSIYFKLVNNCNAYFSYSITEQGVSFSNYPYTHTNYYWDFGDGSTSSEMYPTHLYANNSTYSVKLIVGDTTKSCVDSLSMSVNVVMPSLCNVEFYGESTPNGVKFYNFSNKLPSDSTSLYYWNFGEDASSVSSEFAPTYKYLKEDTTYHVCLTKINTNNGCDTTVCMSVYVSPIDTSCSADFQFVFDTIANKVSFYSTSLGANLNYEWYFGDGGSAFVKDPSYTYTNAGQYNVCLIIKNATAACNNQICKYLEILSSPDSCNANFTFNIDTLGTHFVSNYNSTSSTYFWNFGDGTTSSAKNPIYKYTKDGTYNACLTVSDNAKNCNVDKCQSIYIQIVPIEPKCYTSFEYYTDSSGNINFYNMSDSKLNKFVWNFGDGSTSYLMNPMYKFSDNITSAYVCLTATDTNTNCVAEFCNIINIKETLCKAQFYFYQSDSNNVYFENYTQGDANKYFWDFGDGKYSTENAIQHQYSNVGTYKVCLTVVDTVKNCTDELCQIIVVGQQYNYCVASFQFTVNDSGRVFFNNNSQGEATNYLWDFGDGSTSSQYHSMNKYNNEGVFHVCLSISNPTMGCNNVYCQEVIIGNKIECKSNFKFTKLNNTVNFINLSSSNANKYLWTFGDGNSSVMANPLHYYKKSGVYNVCLTIIDTVSKCQNMFCQNIYLDEKLNCSVDFNYHIDSNGVNITNLSNGAFKYLWNFDNGYVSTQQNPVYKYQKGGKYSICLSAMDTVTQCMASKCIDVNIDIAQPCFAEYMFYISQDTAFFTAETYSSTTKVYWTFGDGKYSTLLNPNNKFTKTGEYNVCLSVIDTVTGCKTIVCKPINIGQITCKANFKPFIDANTQTVFFADMSIGDPSGWYWNFGDGTASTLKNPDHNYNKSGNYQVTLTINNKTNNCSNVYTENIQIGTTLCKANFDYTVNPDSKKVVFENTSTGNLKNFYWSFGDLTFSNQSNTNHNYTKSGIFDVCLLVSDSLKECISYECKKIQVEGVTCKADFNVFVEPDSNIAYFSANVMGAYSQINWEFGDGGKSIQNNPSYKYKAPGYYAVTLTSYDSISGCMSKMKTIIMVNSAQNDCEADFIYQEAPNSSVYFYNNSQGDHLNKYIWNFGDGTKTKGENTTHTYLKGGYYNVCLTAIDSTNPIIANTTCKVIKVGEDTVYCKADFMFNVDAENNVKFEDLSLGNPAVWKWNFDDNKTSSLKNPSNKYSTMGYYLVHLKIQTAGAKCNGNDFKLINVNVPGDTLVAGFGSVQDENNNKENSHPVDFIGASFGDPAIIAWDFGDGSYDSTTLTPTHDYLEAGTYNVCLTIADPVTGEADVNCQEIVVKSISDTTSIQDINVTDLMPICYPNPFNESTYLFYNINKEQNVNVVIYDMLGNKVSDVFNGRQFAGNQKFIISRKSLNSGIYYLNINTENASKTIKLVIVK
ncbi:MAG: hypothetical protein A2X02_10120 [Bacteroidetes bacterium GWF2_29_10]|nr:MAG: hypothetical protein A2X02_10120 [Bacteroidetes bacterium GWF2_29_10]